MTAVLPRTTREIRLAATPEGLPGPEHLAVVDTPMPVLRPGHVLVRNRYFLVFPGLRTLMGDEIDGVPLPRCAAGTPSSGPRSVRSWPSRPAARCGWVTPSRISSAGGTTPWWRTPSAPYWTGRCPTRSPDWHRERRPTGR